MSRRRVLSNRELARRLDALAHRLYEIERHTWPWPKNGRRGRELRALRFDLLGLADLLRERGNSSPTACVSLQRRRNRPVADLLKDVTDALPNAVVVVALKGDQITVDWAHDHGRLSTLDTLGALVLAQKHIMRDTSH